MSPVTIYPDKKYISKLRLAAILFLVFVFAWWSVPSIYAAGHELSGVEAGIALVLITHLPILFLSLWLPAPYQRSIRYELMEDEAIVHVGIITKSVKHVPYRTVTNIEIKRDPFDRMLGLGTLKIQTAGFSGKQGAEESMAGLPDPQAVYDQVVAKLRRHRGALAPTQTEELAESSAADGRVLNEILDEIRAIRRDITKG